MANIRRTIFSLVVSCLYLIIVHGQSTIPASGGNATGSGGSVSYTVGQITCNTFSGINGSIAQGVQQPYEISVVTAVENTEGITLEYKVYPNPNRGSVTLAIRQFDYESMRYRLIDLNGVTIQDKRIVNEVTEISMESLPSAIYFLKLINNNQEVKVFKIIKN